MGTKVEHISFHQDAPLFIFAKTKTDQEEIKNIDHLWHVYQNKSEPVICPLIALVWYIIIHPINLHWSKKKFRRAFPI